MKGILLEKALAYGAGPLEPRGRARHHQLRLNVELVQQLSLPLVGQRRRAENHRSVHLASVHELPEDETRFHGLADAHIVRDQEAHGIQAQRHHQRHELVGSGINANPAEAAERTGARPDGEANGIPQQAA